MKPSFPTKFVYTKSSYKGSLLLCEQKDTNGANLSTDYEAVSFTNTRAGLFHARGDTMAKLQLGVTPSNLGGKRNLMQKTVDVC